MPSLPRQDELAQIETIIRQNSGGMTLPEIIHAYRAHSPERSSERTMRRRLNRLLEGQRIRAEGVTNKRRYFQPTQNEPAHLPGPDVEIIPLSTEGTLVRTMVRQPIMRRRPVGYNEQFLDAYVPGTTWYLPEPTRNHLHEIGRTPDDLRPAGTYARDIYERLLIDLAWASSKLEGNTYSKLDTQNLLENGIRAEGKDASEATMLLNHKNAIALLVEQAEDISFNHYTLFNLHAALSENLLANKKDEGRLRERIVGITGTTFVPLSIPQKIEENFDIILAKATDIPDPFEQSFFMMVHLPYLQPFIDVNKRTSRLAANISLVKANLCPLSFIDVPEQAYVEGTLAVYEFNRVELLRDVFVWAYERSCEAYLLTRDSVVKPDPIRLRFRPQLSAVIKQMVLDLEPPVRSVVQRTATQHEIPAEYLDAFTELAFALLVDLHEGATYRHGIRPSEFQNWKAMLGLRRVMVTMQDRSTD